MTIYLIYGSYKIIEDFTNMCMSIHHQSDLVTINKYI